MSLIKLDSIKDQLSSSKEPRSNLILLLTIDFDKRIYKMIWFNNKKVRIQLIKEANELIILLKQNYMIIKISSTGYYLFMVNNKTRQIIYIFKQKKNLNTI